MNPTDCPALLISAPASGQGKTLSTAALARVCENRGHKLGVIKCGPDFLDPMTLEQASGHAVYHLDLTTCGAKDSQMQSQLQGLGTLQIELAQATLGADRVHYASVESPLTPITSAKTLFGKIENIYQHGSIHAKFLHDSFACYPAATAALLLLH